MARFSSFYSNWSTEDRTKQEFACLLYLRVLYWYGRRKDAVTDVYLTLGISYFVVVWLLETIKETVAVMKGRKWCYSSWLSLPGAGVPCKRIKPSLNSRIVAGMGSEQ